MIELGTKVKDKVTGFTGIAVARTTYLNGCDRYGVQSLVLKDGKPIDWVHFDEPQLEIIEKKSKIKEGRKNTGGERPDPIRR